MKIAFDEHVPPLLVRVFESLVKEGDVIPAEFVSARDYGVPKAKSDVPWLVRFAKEGGRVVISGDKKMRGNLHEQAAIVGSGLVVFFFHPKWNNLDPWTRAASLIKWWPKVQEAINSARPGDMFEIPADFGDGDLRNVTPPHSLPRKAMQSRGGGQVQREAAKE